MNIELTPKDKERFWKKVDKSDDCWIWTAARREGYGAFKVRYLVYGAHQISWMIHSGDITTGFEVCHSCDNRACVNPEHLFLGTRSENMLDMVSKGKVIRPAAKLTPEDVREIRRIHARGVLGCRKIAVQFGVAKSQIQKIVNGETWKDVQ